MGVLLDVYIFVAWFGGWSTHFGFGAFLICLLFAGLLTFAVASSYIGGKISLFMTVINCLAAVFSGGMSLFMAPIVACGSFVVYLLGGGDTLAKWFPSVFPPGGYLFSEATAGVWAGIVFLLWGYLRLSSMLFMCETTWGQVGTALKTAAMKSAEVGLPYVRQGMIKAYHISRGCVRMIGRLLVASRLLETSTWCRVGKVIGRILIVSLSTAWKWLVAFARIIAVACRHILARRRK